MSRQWNESEGWVETDQKPEVREPPLFKVLLHNDHYTSMEFVVMVLETIFRRSKAESVEIMLSVHQKGIGIAGVYPASVAETKIERVHKEAESEGVTLRCSMEPE